MAQYPYFRYSATPWGRGGVPQGTPRDKGASQVAKTKVYFAAFRCKLTFGTSTCGVVRLAGTHMNGHYAAAEVPPLAEACSWELFGVRGAAREHTDASHELNLESQYA